MCLTLLEKNSVCSSSPPAGAALALKNAFSYAVKWDKLYVRWSQGGDVEEIDAFERPGENDGAYKRPDSTAVGSTVEAINPDDYDMVTAVELALL